MIFFDNLEIAFAANSDKEIKRAARLFRLVKNQKMVKTGKALLNIAMLIYLPITGIIRRTIFQHFCGGESIEECSLTVQKLNTYGVKSILDYSKEGGKNSESFDAAAMEIKKVIEQAANHDAIPFAVFKATGIMHFALLEKTSSGQQLSLEEENIFEADKKRFSELCRFAAEKNVPLLIDAEESWIQDTVDDLVLKMMKLYNKNEAIIFNTLQMYRTDRFAYAIDIIKIAGEESFFIGFKLVRGAYMEKERLRALQMGYTSPVYGTKIQTDTSFNNAIELCFENINRVTICCATHNELSCSLLIELMHRNEINPKDNRFWFAQLYGMSNHISFNLAKLGYNTCKYLPYGPVRSVIPYLIRRAEENTSIAGQTGRELQLIEQEMQRRQKTRKQ